MAHTAWPGHPHGIVASLVHLWERRGKREEPMYSPRVIAGLHNLALDGSSRRLWELAARVFEGQAGADEATRVFVGTRRPSVDDDAAVENAAEEEGEGGVETEHQLSEAVVTLPPDVQVIGYRLVWALAGLIALGGAAISWFMRSDEGDLERATIPRPGVAAPAAPARGP